MLGNKIFEIFGAAFIFNHIWELLRIIIPFVSMVIIFALIYKLSPTPEGGLNIKFNHALPGAIFTSVGWILVSMIFS